MKKSCLMIVSVVLLSGITASLHAQGPGGCVNSPENPTAILAVVGSAGVFFASARARIKARRSSSK
jgi:XrtJ-associated TM-motif-TM protein